MCIQEITYTRYGSILGKIVITGFELYLKKKLNVKYHITIIKNIFLRAYVYLIKISYYEQKKPVQNLCRSTNKTNDSIQATISVIFPFSANIFLIVRFCVFNIRQIEVYIHFSGVMTFFYRFVSMFFNHHKKPQLNTWSKLDL